MISEKAQLEITELKKQHPDKRVMLIAEKKGTMGVGSSRMSGVINVALWTGKQASPWCAVCKYCANCCRYKWNFSNILTTVGVTGGIGVDLKNWVKNLIQMDPIINNDDNYP